MRAAVAVTVVAAVAVVGVVLMVVMMIVVGRCRRIRCAAVAGVQYGRAIAVRNGRLQFHHHVLQAGQHAEVNRIG